MTDLERLEAKFIKLGPDECWIWQGACQSQKSYGIIKQGGKAVRAHRLAYQLYKGEIPDGMCVCHTCDVPKCVNPNHLFLGTAKDNAHDMIRKGRKASQVGNQNGRARLDERKAIEILDKRRSGMLLREIADLYNVHLATIALLVEGKTWKHLARTQPAQLSLL